MKHKKICKPELWLKKRKLLEMFKPNHGKLDAAENVAGL